MFTGGDILEINYKHPTLGSGTWKPKSAEAFKVNPGGIKANDDANMITASGEFIDQLNRERWSMEGGIAWDTKNTDELGQARKLAASPDLATFTFTHINGTIWSGKGKPVGDITGDTNAATMTLKVAGEQQLNKL